MKSPEAQAQPVASSSATPISKLPQLQGPLPPSTEQPSTPSKDGPQTRQKRVLPSRSRRGGPGVGSTESDAMILDTMRRRSESEPLIPVETKFLLTTDSSLAASGSAAPDAHLNIDAFGRYFDRPEVRKAYKAAQVIQTPEFVEMPEDTHVGGRFRPRGSEDESADTSDAAYEKRHRKYETFEKRQRLREKEKLKHEHYKLKERIDQLRGMDTSAFLALPASDFSDAPPPSLSTSSQTDALLDEDEAARIQIQNHGAAVYHEGERRRREMLDVALSLEQRYRTLLPPDRRWMEKKALGKPNSKVEPASDDMLVDQEETKEEPSKPAREEEEEEEDEEEEEEEESVAVATPADEDGESELDEEERDRQRSKKLKLRIKFPPGMLAARKNQQESKPPPGPARGGGKQVLVSSYLDKLYEPSPMRSSASYEAPSANGKVRGANGKYLPKRKWKTADSISGALPPTPSKRQRTESVYSAKKSKYGKAADGPDSISVGGHGHRAHQPCVLMVAAMRQATAPTARKTQRHITAFGTRVPPEIEEIRDYEVPAWIRWHLDENDDEEEGESASGNGAGGGEPDGDDESVEIDELEDDGS